MTKDQRGRQQDAVFLIAIGLLIMALCGTCTFTVARTGGAGGFAFFIGAIPTLGGVVIFAFGVLALRKVRNEARRDRDG